MSGPESQESPQERSCATCPSFVKAGEDAKSFLGSDPNANFCAIYGTVLSRKGITKPHEKRILRVKAKACPSYGDDRPRHPDPNKMRFEVVLPHPDAMMYESTATDEYHVDACNGCAHFFEPNEVRATYGWQGGICGAKGKLIGAGRVKLEADRCGHRKRGDSYTSYSSSGSTFVPISELRLLPELHDDFAPSQDPLEEFRRQRANFVDPTEYVTDKALTSEDRKAGLRAWKAIEDAKTGNVTYMPVYDVSQFPKELQALVPRTGDDEHPELYLDYTGLAYKVMVLWRELDETPALWGIAGTGKTEAYRWLAWQMGLPFHRISITASTEVDDLVGKTMYHPDRGTYYQHGRLASSWAQPGVICIDEPNTGQPDVWQLLRPLTDNSKQLVLDQNDGERIIRHDDSFLGFAMNPAWDPRNAGAEPLADADVSRLMHVNIGLPPAQVEREIIRNRCSEDGYSIDEECLALVMGVGLDLRSMSEEVGYEGTWGVRNSIKVARLTRWVSPQDAFMMAVGDFLEPTQREAIEAVVNTHIREK